MFLRSTERIKDGKAHRYFSVVESRRLRSGKIAQRTVLYLGEINDPQQAAWRKTLEVFDETQAHLRTMSLFPEDREVPAEAIDAVQVRLSGMELRRPRSFGDCWLGCELWRELGLDRVVAQQKELFVYLRQKLKNRLNAHAPGLTPKAVLRKLAEIQMLGVWLPTTDGRWLVMPRYTQPSADQALLLHKLRLTLPEQPPPRIRSQSPDRPAAPIRLVNTVWAGCANRAWRGRRGPRGPRRREGL